MFAEIDIYFETTMNTLTTCLLAKCSDHEILIASLPGFSLRVVVYAVASES